MINFKHFIEEAALQDLQVKGFGMPGDRARYQIGDIVIIISDQRWYSYQSKRSIPYIGHYGKIVGYKQVPGSYVKYAVEFPDKNVEAFHSHYLVGPFKDEAIAKKLSKPNPSKDSVPNFSIKKMNPAWLKTSIATKGGKLASNEKLEAYLKTLLTQTPFNFTFLNKPLIFTDSSGKYTITLFATAPLNKHGLNIADYEGDMKGTFKSEIKKYMAKYSCYFKVNNTLTGRFVTEQYGNVKHAEGGPFAKRSYNSPYYITGPVVEFDKFRYSDEIQLNFFSKNLLKVIVSEKTKDYKSLSIRPICIPLAIQKYPKALADTFTLFERLATGKYNPVDLFESYYKVTEENGVKYINENAYVDRTNIDQFKNYHMKFVPGSRFSAHHYNYSLTIVDPDPSSLTIPPNFPCIIISKKHYKKGNQININLKDLSFIPSNVQKLDLQNSIIGSFNGLPDKIIELNVYHSHVKSFEGLPKVIEDEFHIFGGSIIDTMQGGQNTTVGRLRIHQTKFPSLKGVPKANRYDFEDEKTDKLAKKIVKDREFVSKLKPETQKQFGDIFTSL